MYTFVQKYKMCIQRKIKLYLHTSVLPVCICPKILFLISMVLFLAALVTKASTSCLKSTLPLTFRSDTARLFTISILDNNFCFQVKADEMLQWVKVLAGKPDDLSFDLWNSHCGRKELNPSICPLTSTKTQ